MMRINQLKINIVFSFLLFGLVNPVYAKNLGAFGEVYLIEEPDLLQVIQTNVAVHADVFQKEWNEKIQQAMDCPQAVELSRTQQARTWFFDPSVTLPVDVKDEAGKIILSANQIMNPLDVYSLNETLIFYDADDPDQVRWVQQVNQTLKHCKLILINGSVTSQMQLFHKPVYFDQQGRLSTRFQLQHVPAIVMQGGKRLKITEMVPS